MALRDIVINIVANTEGFRNAVNGASESLGGLGDVANNVRGRLSGVTSALKKVAKPAAALAAGVTAAGAAMYGFASSTAAAGDSAAKTADKMGIGVEALQELRFAAERSGVSAKTMDTALQRMTRRLSEAAQGAGPAKDALAEMGLDAGALASAAPEDALNKIADAMAEVGNQSDRVRLAMKLFDSEGVGLVNTLAGGSAGLQEMRDQAQEVGAVISEDTARASEQFQDKMQDLQSSFAGLKNEIGEQLIPLFVDTLIPALVDHVIPALQTVIKVIAEVVSALARIAVKGYEVFQEFRETITGFVDWFAGLPERFVQFGSDIITGFRDGIVARWEDIKQTIFDQFDQLPEWMKKAMGIASPSKLFHQFGEWVAQGFANGVKAGSSEIEGAADGFQSFIDKAQGVLGQSRKIAAAEALINAGRAAAQALADPSLPWWGKAAAAMSVFQTGKQFADAIKSGSGSPGGGASSGGGAAAAPAAAAAPMEVNLSTVGSGEFIRRGDLGDLLNQLQDEAGDRGLRITYA
jgi:phage-related protein